LLCTLDEHSSSIFDVRFSNDKENKNLYLISIGADKSMIFRSYNPFGNLKDDNGVGV
jgi:hypothetical protein